MITFIGPPEGVAEAAFRVVKRAGELIDMRHHKGAHPRHGSTDVCPFVPVRDVTMDFGYGHAFTQDSPEAYERLILDVLLGDPPLFPRQREVELGWEVLDPVLTQWASAGPPEEYPPGSWGPASADAVLARDGRAWRRP